MTPGGAPAMTPTLRVGRADDAPAVAALHAERIGDYAIANCL